MSDNFIYEDIWEEIKSKVSLIDEMEKHGLHLISMSSGKRMKTACPFHAERNPSMIINLNGEVETYKCFGCGVHGSVIDYIMFAERTTLKGALKYFKDNYFLDYAKNSFSLEELMSKEKRKYFKINKFSHMLKISRKIRPFLNHSSSLQKDINALKYLLIIYDEAVELGHLKKMNIYKKQIEEIIDKKRGINV